MDMKSRLTLLPPVKKLPVGTAWDYHTLTRGTIPSKVMSPFNSQVAPRQQGNRGICVGEGTSELVDYIHIILTGQKPTGTIIRDIKVGEGENYAIRDQLYDQTFSCQCIYEWSREEGQVQEPAGSYCNAAIRALYKRGICLESQWWTSKRAEGTWSTPYPASKEVCESEAALHKIEGYAALRTVLAVKEAIAAHGVCLGALNIFANYDQNQVLVNGKLLYDGNLLDPAGECVGSHALCFVGYDDDEQRFYFRHSWEGWTELGSVSYRYWEEAGGDFWVALDTHEAVIGATLYKTLNITSNVGADIKINDSSVGKTPFKTALEIGKTYTIIATANNTTQTQTVEIKDNTDVINFTFSTNPLSDLIKVIIELIMSLFKKRS